MYKRNLRSSRGEVLVHLPDPQILKKGSDDKSSKKVKKQERFGKKNHNENKLKRRHG